MSRSIIECFTDGSCINNGRPTARAGYSAIFPEHSEHNVCEPLITPPYTNNRAEFMGFISAAEKADLVDPHRIDRLMVYTDSALLINSITKWMKGWKARGWYKGDGQKCKNVDLLKRIDTIMKTRDIQFKHVKAHTNGKDRESIYNALADETAKRGAEKDRGSPPPVFLAPLPLNQTTPRSTDINTEAAMTATAVKETKKLVQTKLPFQYVEKEKTEEKAPQKKKKRVNVLFKIIKLE